MEDEKCFKCGKKGYKSDGNGRVWCKKCLELELLAKYKFVTPSKPKQSRNALCECGSEIKYKKC